MAARRARGAPDSVTAAGVTVVSARTCSAGLAIVAEVHMKRTLWLSHSRQTRSSLRSTLATCEPSTPVCACASSTTTNSRLLKNVLVNFLVTKPGSTKWCSASGLVSTICVFSDLIAARAEEEVSPSHTAADTLAMARSRFRSEAFLGSSKAPESARRPAVSVKRLSFSSWSFASALSGNRSIARDVRRSLKRVRRGTTYPRLFPEAVGVAMTTDFLSRSTASHAAFWWLYSSGTPVSFSTSSIARSSLNPGGPETSFERAGNQWTSTACGFFASAATAAAATSASRDAARLFSSASPSAWYALFVRARKRAASVAVGLRVPSNRAGCFSIERVFSCAAAAAAFAFVVKRSAESSRLAMRAPLKSPAGGVRVGTDDFAPGATFSSASFARFAAGVTPIHSPRSSFTGNAPGGLPMEKRFFSFRAASATTLAALASRVTLRSTRAGEAAEGPPATPPIPRTGSPSGRMLREPRGPLSSP
mmetsp:Transcript_2868/g.11835  ORF Transcript_2868/g.11835 Transcript_2868/m.11835 type:complete len:478 (+) Transcript_2868:1298-2731(+)